jgi:hypothetical protein
MSDLAFQYSRSPDIAGNQYRKSISDVSDTLCVVLTGMGSMWLADCQYVFPTDEEQELKPRLLQRRDPHGRVLTRFLDDVEINFRSVYGNFDAQAARRFRYAVFEIMRVCTFDLLGEVWKDYYQN